MRLEAADYGTNRRDGIRRSRSGVLKVKSGGSEQSLAADYGSVGQPDDGTKGPKDQETKSLEVER